VEPEADGMVLLAFSNPRAEELYAEQFVLENRSLDVFSLVCSVLSSTDERLTKLYKAEGSQGTSVRHQFSQPCGLCGDYKRGTAKQLEHGLTLHGLLSLRCLRKDLWLSN
jgi:hypothetical protein